MDQGSGLKIAANHLVAFSRSLTRPLERKVLAALLSPVVVMLVAGIAFLGIQRMRESQSWVTHTREVNDTLRQTELALVEAESGLHAFLLTQAPPYRDHYRAAARGVRTLLGQLQELIRDNPAEVRRAAALKSYAEANLAELSRILDAFQASGLAAARDALLASDAEKNLQLARGTIAEMVAAERFLLIERSTRRDRQIEFTNWVIAAGSLFAALLAVVVNIAIRHDITLQRKNQALLEDQAARLESQRNTLEANERALARQLDAERSLSDRLAAASAAAEMALAERNTASAALERSNRELNQFAYVASHDLKAPLRGIANLAQWVEEDLGEAMTGTAREHIRVLLSRVRRMDSLIDGILAYARAGRADGQREQIDVGALVQEVRELLAPPVGMFSIVVDPNLPRVTAVRAPFQQVWMNLLGNAFKHARRAGAEIHVGVAERAAEWEFSISDNGPGIAPQYHQRVFGIFQTLAARDKLEGTGIGLATVKKLVESEGGRVWVESQTGQGATFRFTWPKMQAHS
jgi:signal transduction histidine kinase